MKTEIEARLLDVDVKQFIKKLEQNNATKVGDWLQSRNCYDFTPVRENSWIRLRKEGDKTTLTIKEVKSSKIDGTKECEIEVSDFATTDELLNRLGYFARSFQENRRIRYVLDSVEIDIDFWPFIPTYVEFEAPNEESIKSLCNKLEIDYSKLTSIDVTNIYKHYGIDFSSLPNKIALEEERKKEKF